MSGAPDINATAFGLTGLTRRRMHRVRHRRSYRLLVSEFVQLSRQLKFLPSQVCRLDALYGNLMDRILRRKGSAKMRSALRKLRFENLFALLDTLIIESVDN